MVSADDYPKHDVCMEKSGLDKECSWKVGEDMTKCPHTREIRDHGKKIKDSVLDCVGNTPMIRINNITKQEGIECELLVKAEFLNPGGSVKDRIGRRMVLDAEKQGRIKEGDIIIEPTSGNTGVGLSMAAAARGYRMIITMPEKMSQEKQDALTGLGATVIRTPTSYAFNHAESHVGIAFKLEKELQNAHVLDQYKNPSNPMAHFEETGQEIWDQCDGKIDYVFMGAGTGGTLTGISRKLKQLNKNIKIIAIDPEGSILAQPENLNGPGPEKGQQVEGIGYDFIPRVIDRTLTDEWIKGPDKESYNTARRLLREEGLMCGGSSGTAFWAALEYIKTHDIGKGKRCVVILPDNIRNYMTKHLNNDWMYERGYITEEECAKGAVSDLVPSRDWGQELTVADMNLNKAVFVQANTPIIQVCQLFQSKGYAQYPVKRADGEVLGIVTKAALLESLVKQRVKPDDKVSAIVPHYSIRHVSKNTSLSELGRVLVRNKFVLVENEFFVTTSDLLKTFTDKCDLNAALSAVQPQNDEEKKTEDKDSGAKDAQTPRGDGEKKGSSTMLKKIGVASVGIIAAGAAVFLAKKQH